MKKIILTIAVVCLVGCVQTRETLKEMPSMQVASRGTEKLMPMDDLPVVQVVDEIREREKYFSLSVNNMELRNVFFILAREISEYNVVVDPDVTGAVTVSFNDLPLEKVLAVLLEPLGLEYTIENSILRISKPRVATRTFEFVYSTTLRTSQSSLMAVTGSGGSGSNQVSGSSFDSINTIEEVNVWEELETGIRELLSVEGVLSTNRRTGRITLTDFRSNLRVIEDFIEYFKRETMRQIHIKAKILEITLTDQSAWGIDWSYLFKFGQNALAIGQAGFAPGGGFTVLPSGEVIAAASQPLDDFDGLVTGTMLGTSGDLKAVVSALEGQGNVNVISSPQVTTLNGQTAIFVSITEDVVF